ncbi:MAG: hypothetical protein V4717_04260 [Bacteroidota bacterium]
MKQLTVILFILGNTSLAIHLHSQSSPSGSSVNLFGNDSILQIGLIGDIKELLNDRSAKSEYYKMKLVHQEGDQTKSSDINIKTRGHFRKLKENCNYPPLLINFNDSSFKGSQLFGQNDKLKLVMPCKSENYVIREWLAYKLYNIITPVSLQAKLVKLKMTEAKKGKEYPPLFGILIENEKDAAARVKLNVIKRELTPGQFLQENYLTMAFFQYLIGNTDWSVEYRQNVIVLVGEGDTRAIAMAYDFDHSGLVNAPYAQPAEALEMKSVSERRYRGYCITDVATYEPIIAHYNSVKPKVYELLNNCQLLDDKEKVSIIKYIDEFYATINDPARFKKDFLYPCDKKGTGNVVIKGLRDDSE